jgi:hypothetical protein
VRRDRSLPATLDPRLAPCGATIATERANILFGCYRSGEANDPAIYAAAVAAVLADYPAEVVRRVTDPRSGLPRRVKWLPTVSEVAAACDVLAAPIRFACDWDARTARQLADRAVRDAQAAAPGPDVDSASNHHNPPRREP